MILAQADIGQIAPGALKEIIVFTVAAVVAASFFAGSLFAGLSYLLERRRATREEETRRNPPPTTIEPNPLPIQKIFPSATVKQLEEKHDEHGRRIDGHDKEIQNLWMTMRTEDKEIRQDVSDKFDAISRSLGRIEGHIAACPFPANPQTQSRKL